MADAEKTQHDQDLTMEYEKNLRDLGLLFLFIVADKQMPMSAREFAKQKPEIARSTGLEEDRLIELYKFALESAGDLMFNKPKRKEIGGFHRKA